MASITEVDQAMRAVLVDKPEEVARRTRFTKRKSKLSGAKFVQTIVLGFLGDPEAPLSKLSQVAAALGVGISCQGLDQRFSPEAAALLEEVLGGAVCEVISSDPVAIPILERFSAVLLQDSSIINLPDSLAGVWKGCGGTKSDSYGNHASALKIQVRLDMLDGTLYGPVLEHGRSHDRSSSLAKASVPKGALKIADLGYFSLRSLGEIARQEAFFLSRHWAQSLIFNESGEKLDLLGLLEGMGEGKLDVEVWLGEHERLGVRLLAERVPQEVADQRRRKLKDEARRRQQPLTKRALRLANWTVLITNVPRDMLSIEAALVMMRVRWQVELLFKLWKQHGKVDEWRTNNPWRILCETYAKLVAMVIEHWLLLVSLWAYPDRSLVKAAQAVKSHAFMLAGALTGSIGLAVVIEQITICLGPSCRMNRRRQQPNTYQLLMDC